MRNGIPNLSKTTWPNTDAGINPKEFYGPGLNRQISIHEMGGGAAFKDSMEHLSQAEELKHAEWAKEAITELKSLMRGQQIGNNSPGSLKFSVYLTDRIA